MGGTKRNRQAETADSLEHRLSLVVEQEGVTISTPRGRTRLRKRKTEIMWETSPVSMESSRELCADEISVLDQTVADSPMKVTHRSRVAKIPIRSGAHERSPFVVSLQHVRIASPKPAQDRISLPAQAGLNRSFSMVAQAVPVQAYATVRADLTMDADPRFIADQFTPATFEQAFAAVYGPMDRWRVVLREHISIVSSLFHRFEKTEQHILEDVEQTFSVVDVPRLSFARALVGFAVLVLIVTLPANAVALYRSVSEQKDAATNTSEQAIGEVMNAVSAGSMDESAQALERASARFREADKMLSDSSALALGIASFLPNTYRSGKALLEVGDKVSEAARLLTLGLDKVFSDTTRRLDERLDIAAAYARTALTLLSDANKAAASVDPGALPADQRERIMTLLARLDQSTQAVQELSALADALSLMVGKEQMKKYLVIFQNNTELRPTGGFMGSFAEVTFDRGAIKSIRVPPGGTYELKGQLLARVISPEPLHLINSRWQFQDANWSPDFPTSANKIRWFWSQSGQSTVDGVISINASVVERMLALTGPIDMPEYGKIIDASNFIIETQKAVELEYDKQANTPKKFVGDLGTKLIDRLKDLPKEKLLGLVQTMSEALDVKDIQLAFRNPEDEALAEKYGWNGRLQPTIGDSLALVEANIAGQKTDGVVDETVAHQVNIGADGSIEDDVVLTRTHNGKKGELFRGVRNVVYLRAYVPKGSKLIAATGFQTPDKHLFKATDEDDQPDAELAAVEATQQSWSADVRVGEEADRTVIGGWLQLDPGSSQTVHLRYRLPFTVGDILSRIDASPDEAPTDAARGAYVLLLTSQSGKTNRALTTTVHYPPSWSQVWSRPTMTSGAGKMTDSTMWDRDKVYMTLFSSHEQGNTTSIQP